jgi:hypothetical protein
LHPVNHGSHRSRYSGQVRQVRRVQLGAGLRGRHSGRLAAEAVKIWADGGMSSRTAAIHGSYPVPPYGRSNLSGSRTFRSWPL